jgi:hypothetical protein
VPSVKSGKAFLYFDAIDQLGAEAQARWSAAGIAEQMIREAIDSTGLENDQLVLA